MESSNAPATSSPPRGLEAAALVALALLAGWLMFVDLGAASFHDGDEALYATVAREMAASGELFTPTYWGEPLLNKPPLMYWLMSGSIEFLPGNFEWQSRFPSALMGLVLIGLVYWTARRLGGAWTALGASLLMLGNHQYLFEHCVRSANLDSGLVTLMFAAIAFGARAHESRRDRILSGVFTALVLMVKLPLAVFIVPTLFVHLWFQEPAAAWRWLTWASGAVALIALPWHVYALASHGSEFWDVYVMYEIFGRTGEAVLDPDATWWTHLLAFWRSFLPWGPWITMATVCALLGWPADARERATARLLAGYALFVLVFLCFIKSKWPWYGIPAYPALAVVGATFVHHLFRSRWRAAAPLVVALPAIVRLLAVSVRGDYTPAARAARMWPIHSKLYGFELGAASPAAWSLAALLLALALLPLWKPARRHSGGLTLAVALLALAPALATLARVPREHSSSVSRLTEALARRQVDRLLTVGFWPSETYGGRQTPIVGAYFLAVPGAEVTDCRDNFDCLDEGLTVRTALVIHRSALKPRMRQPLVNKLRGLRAAPEVWILDPGAGGGFEQLDWR